jgi:hypothetical protein
VAINSGVSGTHAIAESQFNKIPHLGKDVLGRGVRRNLMNLYKKALLT